MRTYATTDFRAGFEIGDQSENFVFVRDLAGIVMISTLEYLLSIGLQCCGVSTETVGTSIIACLKVKA